mmetsp:Transcript_4701/g.8948  ORF Transcript_4701/g.8948 Transcript_4701/m.8948 type:complete len:327 (+) Transcript_4701:80-1060(+)
MPCITVVGCAVTIHTPKQQPSFRRMPVSQHHLVRARKRVLGCSVLPVPVVLLLGLPKTLLRHSFFSGARLLLQHPDLLQQLLFILRHLLRDDNFHVHVMVPAVVLAPEDGNASVSHDERGLRLRALRHLHVHQPVNSLHLDLLAENGIEIRDLSIGMNRGTLSPEFRVGLHVYLHEQIALGPAADARVPLAAHPEPLAAVDAGGDAQRYSPAPSLPPLPRARTALLESFSRALAVRAGLHLLELPQRRAHDCHNLTLAAARGARAGLAARRHAGPRARLACLIARDLKLFVSAEDRVHEVDVERDHLVLPRLHPALPFAHPAGCSP